MVWGGRIVKYSIIKIPSKLAEEIDKLIEKMGFTLFFLLLLLL